MSGCMWEGVGGGVKGEGERVDGGRGAGGS